MSNSLVTVHLELVAEWSEKNLPLIPDSITFGSHKKVIWKCKLGHEWIVSHVWKCIFQKKQILWYIILFNQYYDISDCLK